MTDKPRAQTTRTILVIDDDPTIRMLLRVRLEKAGYAVHESHEGGHGLVTARQKEFALAIVDLYMPGQEGLETILALRREIPTMKLIAISGGSGYQNLMSAAKAFGADLTIHKPLDLDQLLNSVTTLIGTHSSPYHE